ncbi:helix-turn-helix domain-containing protein [Leucobacter sp. gxy201]|uniref:helix-turn-helix transcriptional regulator n=1 Tax=Leucobacter sp. gxy201 TaxID=2957200 RepID=UPI003DA0E7E8
MRNDIRARRAERRWSQAELGARLGVSRQTIIAIESGKYDPSLPLAFKLAAVFGTTIEAIFDPGAVAEPEADAAGDAPRP